MRARGLLSVLTFSEKRKDLLFLLLSEPKTVAEIKSYFNVSSPEILPRIKEMEAKNLIYKKNRKYALTPIGKVVATLFKPLVNTLRVIDENEEFWKEHALEAIPQHLLERIGELGNCKLIEHKLESIYEPHKEFLENILNSKKVRGISPIVHPIYPSFFLQLAEKGVDISLVLTRSAFNKIEKEYSNLLARGLSFKNSSLYVSDEDIKLACIVTDVFFSISLFFKNIVFDSKKDLISFDKSALLWGEELFEYYKERSEEIKRL